VARVYAGVISGIVEGMASNSEMVGVLQLASDVIGNLGSLDEEEGLQGGEIGVEAMQAGLQWRKVRQCGVLYCSCVRWWFVFRARDVCVFPCA
jgi:hypothetical protein